MNLFHVEEPETILPRGALLLANLRQLILLSTPLIERYPYRKGSTSRFLVSYLSIM